MPDTHISITKEHKKYLDEHGLSATKVLRNKIKELMEDGRTRNQI